MPDQQLNDAKIKPIYHFPLALGGVAPIYNRPKNGLRFPARPWPISTWARWPCGTTRPSPRTTRA